MQPRVYYKPHIKILNNLISVIKFKEKNKMSNKDLFKEAIADAKAVREAALANAKVALEEALAPKLQSMLAAKLQEMDMDMDDENLEEVDHSSDNYNTQDPWHKLAHERGQADAIGEGEDAELEEDFDLSSILAELSEYAEEQPNRDMDGDGDVDAEDVKKMNEDEDEDEEMEDEDESEMESITDLTMDELKDIIKDIISSEMGGDEMDADMEDMGGEDEMSMDFGGEEGDEEVGIEMDADEEEIDEIDLEELLAELDALGESDDDEGMYEAKKAKKKEDDKEDMKEAIDTIEALRNELNEVNLLNAKLLYVNKVFKAKNLNESQKLKVIAQFDKATTAREAKAIFESMNNAIAKSKKSTIKESLGFASKAAGVAPKKQIVQVDETMSRWQMLAGITKY
jgi:hypothetical protein